MSADAKSCPQCISEVPGEAQVCRHCGYIWPGSDMARKRQARRRDIILFTVMGLLAAAGIWRVYDVTKDDRRDDCQSYELSAEC